MAFWCRINQSRLKHLTNQLKRCYPQVPLPNYSGTHTKIRAAENPFWGTVKRPTDLCNNVRFFAAPVQVQQKKEEKDCSGPRLNDQIKAKFLRLVTDDGHKIVSRDEALALAGKLQLDLVEVQKNADPPVCKIMDFHKEKYKKEVKEKDRAKAKSDTNLKKGACKEVRFSGKIEQKDLKMKADTVKRLMERGYRVKCMALPVGKKEEAEDLGGYLSRLTALIEDISIVESGPHVERKQAYVIIRHVKYGPSKKGGGKKSKAVGDTSGVGKTATQPPIIDRSGNIPSPAFCEEDPAEFGLESEDETLGDEVDLPSSPSTVMQDKNIGINNAAWSVSNSTDDFNKLFNNDDDTKGVEVMNTASETAHRFPNLDASYFSHTRPVVGLSIADTLQSTPGEPSPETENRYKRSEPRSQFPQKSIDNLGPGVRDSFRVEPQFCYQRRQPSPNMNVSPSTREKKQGGTDASFSRNPNFPNSMPSKQDPSHSDIPNTRAPGYGIFSNSKANAPAAPGVTARTHRNNEGIPSDSVKNPVTAGDGANQNIPGSKLDGGQRSGLDNGGQRKWGMFSK